MLVPGPPNECRPSSTPNACPACAPIVPPRHIAKRTLRAAMIPESQADKLLAPIYTTYKDVETTILAHAGDIQLTLLCAKPDPDAAQQRVDELAGRMEEALDDWLYSSGGESADSLEQIVLYYLGLRHATLAVAESCTGGMIAQRITSVPGSSRSFLGGAIVYSDALKTRLRRRPPRAHRPARRSLRRSSQSPRHRHPPPHRRNSRLRRYRHRRPHRRNRSQTRRPGPHRPLRRPKNRVHRKHLPRRPRPQSANGPPSKPWT